MDNKNDVVIIERPTQIQIKNFEIPFRLTTEQRSMLNPVEEKLHEYQERTVPDIIHGMHLSDKDKYLLVVDHFAPSEEQEAVSTRKQFPDTYATYRLDDAGTLMVESVNADIPPVHLNKNEVEFNHHKNHINMENSKFLKDQLTYLGFGHESIINAVDDAIKSGNQRFTLTVRPQDETLAGNKAVYELNFNKSSQTDMYFFNNFKTSLIDKSENPLRAQQFHVNDMKGVTAKESINLLEGRSVKTVLHYNGQDANVFTKLNFDETNKYGNFRYKTFHENYGVDVKDILGREQQRAGLQLNDDTVDKLVKSLEKGNLIKSDFLVAGNESKGYIALNPEFKNLDFFDENLKKVNYKQLGQQQHNLKEEESLTVSVDTPKSSVGDDGKNKQQVNPDANPLSDYREDDFTEALIDAVRSKNINTDKSEPVVLAELSEKQSDKLKEFYQNGEGKLPSVTPKQMETVPKVVFGQELSNEQRRDLIFGNEVKLDEKTTVLVELFGKKELNVIREGNDGTKDISTVQKSDVKYNSPTKELKPFESAEEIPDRSNSISR